MIFSIGVYANTLNNGFVFDDKFTIVGNRLITDFSNIPMLFRDSYFSLSGEMTYRPVVTFTYFVDYFVYSLKPWGYHLTNTLLHAVNGVMLYIFLSLLLKKPASDNPGPEVRPLLVSLLFASHPVLTEALNAVSFREDLLVFFFYMAALNLYLLSRLSLNKALSAGSLCFFSCLLYLAALMSKEMALTFPIVVYCYEWTCRDMEYNIRRSVVLNRYNIGYIAVTLGYSCLRFFYLLNPLESNIPAISPVTRLFTIPWIFINYLKLIFFPIPLSADYMIPFVKSCLSLSFIVPSTLAFFFVLAAFKIRKQKGETAFGMLFFLITLIPVYNLVPITNPFAERYLYLPLAGVMAACGTAIPGRMGSRPRGCGIYLLLLYLAILGIFSVRVFKRNELWKSDYSLWSYTLRRLPENSYPHNNLGVALVERGRVDEALREFQNVLRLMPNDADSHNNIGNVYMKKGQVGKAVQEYEASVRINPDEPRYHFNLGYAYFKEGRTSEAVQQYQNSLKLDPYVFVVHSNLGVAYASQGRDKDALEEFRVAIRLNPSDHLVYNNLGLAYAKLDRLDDAVRAFLAALTLKPGSEEVHYNLGVAYLKKGTAAKAMVEFEAVVKLNPGNLAARQALESIKR